MPWGRTALPTICWSSASTPACTRNNAVTSAGFPSWKHGPGRFPALFPMLRNAVQRIGKRVTLPMAFVWHATCSFRTSGELGPADGFPSRVVQQRALGVVGTPLGAARLKAPPAVSQMAARGERPGLRASGVVSPPLYLPPIIGPTPAANVSPGLPSGRISPSRTNTAPFPSSRPAANDTTNYRGYAEPNPAYNPAVQAAQIINQSGRIHGLSPITVSLEDGIVGSPRPSGHGERSCAGRNARADGAERRGSSRRTNRCADARISQTNILRR